MTSDAATHPGALMASEIAEQPSVLARLLTEGTAEIAAVRSAIERFQPRFVLLAGRGTSDHAALYAKYLVEVRRQLPAGLVSPSTLTLYRSRPDLSNVLFLAVSQSGGTPDLVASVEAARSRGALTVAVTNSPASPLAAAAAHHVDVRAGTERAVTATKSYTAELLALYLLLDGGDAGRVPEAAQRTLADGGRAYAAVEQLRSTQRLITTARGFSYPSAREAALKVMETSYLSAQAFSGADLLHGPWAVIDPSLPVIAIVSPGVGGTAMAPVVARLVDAGANVLLVGSAAGLPAAGLSAAGLAAELPVAGEGIAEELLPILEILPLQQLAWRLAMDRGNDPDRPRGLSKVTETW
jgi:glucosamine--fructose-6-phosphate aminotransferase (isomerizing)